MTQDETVSSVNAEPVESVSNTPVEPVVDTTAPATPSKAEETSKPKSIREVASEAFDKIAAAHEKPNTDASKGKTDHTPAKALPVLPGAKPATEATPSPEIDQVTGKPLEAIKAPASWTPSLREKWSTVPRDIQKFITDRERDMAVTLDKTAQDRKAAKEWADSTSPYADFCKQFNTTPVAHAKELLDMSRALNMGNPQQKAQILHNLIMHFKPDFAVMQALSRGQAVNIPAQQQQAPLDINAEVEKRIAQQTAERQEAEAQAVIDKFANDPSNEFYGDVQVLMGKAIDGGFVQGATTEELLKKAYDFACAQHPEVKLILGSRSKTTTPPASPQKPAVQPVRSVKPSLGAGAQTKVQKQYKTRREAIEAAYEAISTK